MTYRTYKFRIYPTNNQLAQLQIEFGHARFVWNWALDMRNKAYLRRGESLKYAEISRRLTQLKQSCRYRWLCDATASCHTQKLIDLDRAFKNFFEGRARYPRFKKKYATQSVRYQLDQREMPGSYVGGERLLLRKLGPVRVRWSRVPHGVPKMATVKRDAAGRYFVSLSVEETVEAKPKREGEIGVDVGIKDVVVTSDGFKSGAPKHTYRYARKLRRAQRSLSRKKMGSGRRCRQKKKVARIHARIRDSRQDFLHKLTTRLINENQVIAIEDLNVRGMLSNRSLSKAIADSSFQELRRQLAYKAEWYGRQLIVINRFEPTSKRCSRCGEVNEKLMLSDRIWTCKNCGDEHDRDVNAAINILATAGSAESEARGGCKNPETRAA